MNSFHASRTLLAAALFTTLTACQPTPITSTPHATEIPIDRALDILLTGTQSTDPIVRANCIEALQPSPNPRVPAAIAIALHDTQWVVRFSATMAIGKRQMASFRDTLAGMITTDPSDSVRVACAYALRQLGDLSHMNLLSKALSDTDPAARANAAFVLGLIKDKSAIPLLLSHDSEVDPQVRFEITAALARLGYNPAEQIILSMALSRYPSDQWNAMAVCVDLPPGLAANALNVGLQPVPDAGDDLKKLITRRQLVAARSLAKLHSAQGAKIAFDNLKNDEPGLRALAAFALGEMLVPSQDYVLLPLLGDKDAGVKRAAAAAIVTIHANAVTDAAAAAAAAQSD